MEEHQNTTKLKVGDKVIAPYFKYSAGEGTIIGLIYRHTTYILVQFAVSFMGGHGENRCCWWFHPHEIRKVITRTSFLSPKRKGFLCSK